MWLGLKEVCYCECIGRDIGCGCRGEDDVASIFYRFAVAYYV